MAILNYEEVKTKARTLKAMTSLDRAEFEQLAEVFGSVWGEQQRQAGYDAAQGGRPPALKSMEQKLFFILFHLKTYPLEEVLGHLFGFSQGQANVWIHRLSKVLRETLQQQAYLPARLPAEMLERLAQEELQSLGIDGTERRIQRPQDDEQQRQHYSGKKKPIR